MSKRLILIPRWGGMPASDWYPWLERELAAVQPPAFTPVQVAEMPHPELPTIPAWRDRVQTLLGNDAATNACTVLAAHSVGCQAAMRALAAMPAGTKIAGLFFVAGWFATDAPWDALMPWIKTPFDREKVRAAAGKIVVVISDNDHHTHDWRGNRQLWEQRMGAQVVVVSGADHFNGPAYSTIRDTLLDQFGSESADGCH